MLKKIILSVIVFILCYTPVYAEKNRHHEFRGFKNAIIVEESPQGPLIEVAVIYFTAGDGIFIDTKYPSPEMISYSWDNMPRVFYTDSDGTPSEVFISPADGYIIAGDKIIAMPCKLE